MSCCWSVAFGMQLFGVVYLATFTVAADEYVAYECPLNTLCHCVSPPNTTHIMQVRCNGVRLYKFPGTTDDSTAPCPSYLFFISVAFVAPTANADNRLICVNCSHTQSCRTTRSAALLSRTTKCRVSTMRRSTACGWRNCCWTAIDCLPSAWIVCGKFVALWYVICATTCLRAPSKINFAKLWLGSAKRSDAIYIRLTSRSADRWRVRCAIWI